MPHTSILFGLEEDNALKSRFPVGQGHVLHLPRGPRRKGYLYRHGALLREVDRSEKLQRQTLVVDLLRQGVNQSDLAKALDLSRQTLHNYREIYDRFGLEGFVHGYTPSTSKSRET